MSALVDAKPKGGMTKCSSCYVPVEEALCEACDCWDKTGPLALTIERPVGLSCFPVIGTSELPWDWDDLASNGDIVSVLPYVLLCPLCCVRVPTSSETR